MSVFGDSSSSQYNGNKTDTSLFVEKPYLRTNYIETSLEEDIDLKNSFRYENLPDPISNGEAASKNYVDNKFNKASVIKDTAHRDLNERNLTNARIIQDNQLPQIDSHLAAKWYVDNAVEETSLVRNNQDNDFNNHSLTNLLVLL